MSNVDVELKTDLSEHLKNKGLVKQSVDNWLDQVDYKEINSGTYQPSAFALKFLNFIKLVNGEEGEQNLTPVVHLKMLDEIAGDAKRVANLCARGIAKTTLMFEYLFLYIAVFGDIDGFGSIDGMIYVSDSMDNGVKSARKNVEFRYNQSDFLKEQIPYAHFTDSYIETKNKSGKLLGCKMFGAKTGLRGTKVFGKRPVLAVLDDLVSDDDAKSKVAMENIKDTVYKGIDYALDPRKRKIVFNGTPFNKNDILYEAVESGGWRVNVYPICEKFPCSKEEFNGAWEDRFTFDFVKDQYEVAVATGKVSAFMQELMLRITSDEERLVLENEIRWYSRQSLLQNKHKFNFYITTDFATKAQQHNDFSVISVWAYNNNGDWFWVDGLRRKQTMNITIDDLFKLVVEYEPQSVGIETNGQQGAFINWLQSEMLTRNTWFNFASNRGNTPGIHSDRDKLERFNLVVPLFKSGKMYFPSELRNTTIMGGFIEEISMAMITGIKSKHDDALDTVSQLAYLKPWKPSEASDFDPLSGRGAENPWEIESDFSEDVSPFTSYIC